MRPEDVRIRTVGEYANGAILWGAYLPGRGRELIEREDTRAMLLREVDRTFYDTARRYGMTPVRIAARKISDGFWNDEWIVLAEGVVVPVSAP